MSPSTTAGGGVYEATGIRKVYGGVTALTGIDLQIVPGEVQALLGANGAGKSTLVKILVGAETPTEGRLSLDGEEVRFRSSADAAAAGIAIVSQELNLFADLDVLENLFLLRERRYGGVVLNRAEMAREAAPVLDLIGLHVAPGRPVGTLRLAERQLLEIARSLLVSPRILFLDEPTSALGPADTDRLLDVIRRLRDSGVAIVYVSHFLEDVFAVSDTVTVVRNGRVEVSRRPASEMTIAGTVAAMLGEAAVRETTSLVLPPVVPNAPDDPANLRLRGAAALPSLHPLDLVVRPGEVVGLAGLEGSGAAAVIDLVFGRRRLDAGTIAMPGGGGAPRSMTAAVRSGVAYVPADRKRLGVMLDKSIQENMTLVAAGPLKRMGVFLRGAAMRETVERWRSQLGIAMRGPETPVGQLSGGNQQKVVFAKWLETDPRVVLLDDPSRGVDIGAKAEMHAIIAQLAVRGRIVLVASTDLAELVTVCHRVVVFFQGAAVGELEAHRLTEHDLLEAVNTGRLPEAVPV